MTAPTYNHDLTTLTTAETTTGWVAYGGGASGLSASPDLSMQGTNCVDKQITNAEKGQLYDNGSGVSMSTGDHVYIWLFVATPGLTDTLANRGVVCNIGNSTTAFVKYHVEGNDTYGAGGRTGRCYPIDPTVQSSNTGSVPYRTLVGSPNGTLQYFGGGMNTTASVKGANLGVDAIRYGTGAYITAGDATTPATFNGFATQNDSSTNRWGILTYSGGVYELQGRFVVGQDNTKTATAARFEDSNAVVVIIDTPHSATDFSQIIIDHASTVFNLTNITVLALGTNNPGRLVFNNASTTSSLDTCTFDSIGISTLRGGVTATSCTWRNSDQITQNSATLDGCLFDSVNVASGTAALKSDDPSLVSDCNFVSSGTGHAIEITTAGTYAFTGNTFSGYGAAGTNDATIYNSSGGAVTLNVTGGGDTDMTVRNSSGSTTTISASFKHTLINLELNTEVTYVKVSDGSVLFHVENASTSDGSGKYKTEYTHSGGDVVDILIHNINYLPDISNIYNLTLPNADATVKVQMFADSNYVNPA